MQRISGVIAFTFAACALILANNGALQAQSRQTGGIFAVNGIYVDQSDGSRTLAVEAGPMNVGEAITVIVDNKEIAAFRKDPSAPFRFRQNGCAVLFSPLETNGKGVILALSGGDCTGPNAALANIKGIYVRSDEAQLPLPSAERERGPSFDCRRASAPSERTICANPKLSQLDRRVAKLYAEALTSPQTQGLHVAQRKWIAGRDRCRANVRCLRKVYRQRLDELRGAAATAERLNIPAGLQNLFAEMGNEIEGSAGSGDTPSTVDAAVAQARQAANAPQNPPPPANSGTESGSSPASTAPTDFGAASGATASATSPVPAVPPAVAPTTPIRPQPGAAESGIHAAPPQSATPSAAPSTPSTAAAAEPAAPGAAPASAASSEQGSQANKNISTPLSGESPATQETSTESSPAPNRPAAYSSEVARNFGLRTLLGRPIVINGMDFAKILDKEETASLRRFLDFVRLGVNSALDTANQSGPQSLCFANDYLQESEKNSLLSPNPQASAKDQRPWLGTGQNEFEVARVRKIFHDQYLPELVAAAPKLPLELAFVARVTLQSYDEKRGGFPFRGVSPKDQFGLPASPCAAYESTTLKTPGPLPSLWSIDPERAEKVVAGMPVDAAMAQSGYTLRTVYEAVIFSLENAPNVGLSARIKSVMLYRDKALTQLLYTFPLDLPHPDVLQSGLPAKIPQYRKFDEEAVDLLLLRDDGDVLDDNAWQALARRQLSDDEAYYARTTIVAFGGTSIRDNPSRFAPQYVPFFPYGFTISQSTPIDENTMEEFKKWSMARAKVLPASMRLLGEFRRGQKEHDQAVSFGKPVDQHLDAPLLSALASKGYSAGQLVRPVFQGLQVSDFDSRLMTGRNEARTPVLVLSRDAETFQLDLSKNPTALPYVTGRGAYTSYPVDIDLRVDRTELIPLDARNEIFAIFVTPTAAQVKSYDLNKKEVLFEQAFGAGAPEPQSAALTPTVQATKSKTAPAPQPSQASAPDILGIKIGMTFTQAEEIIRHNMDVALVMTADRKWQSRVSPDAIEPYSSGQMFISRDGKQIITIYDEPPAKPEIVLGVSRRVGITKELAQSAGLKKAVQGELVKKYGNTDKWVYLEFGKAQVWTEAPPRGNLVGYLGDGCNIESLNAKRDIWRLSQDPPPDPSALRLQQVSVDAPALKANGGEYTAQSTSSPNSLCRVGVAAAVNVDLVTPPLYVDMWLFDDEAYGKAFLASKAMLEKNASAAGEAAAQNLGIKF